jgi:hypothetical protein
MNVVVVVFVDARRWFVSKLAPPIASNITTAPPASGAR